MTDNDKPISSVQLQFNAAKKLCKPYLPARPAYYSQTRKPNSYEVLKAYGPGDGSLKCPGQPPSSIPAQVAGIVDEDKNPRSTPPAEKEKAQARAQVATCVGQQVVGRMSGGLKPNDSKSFRISVRFSETEREILVRHAEKSCLTVSEYIRASVLGAGYLSAIDPIKRELLKNVSRELGRQGNNLNQIAKHLNGGTASPEQGDSMLAMLARSLLSAHQIVRQALTEGKQAP